jgi:hypothetical protein
MSPERGFNSVLPRDPEIEAAPLKIPANASDRQKTTAEKTWLLFSDTTVCIVLVDGRPNKSKRISRSKSHRRIAGSFGRY